jgi:hypothetical protein
MTQGVLLLGLTACLMAGGCKREQPAATPTPEAPPEPGREGASAPGSSGAQASPAPAPPREPEWTAGIVDVRYSGPKAEVVTLREVRSARNEGFDRVVFEFEGAQVPGYHVEYVDTPVIKCGSGDPTEVAGQGWLQVRLEPAQAHVDGEVTVAERERKPGLPLLQELELTCDFEAQVTWVLGVKSPNRYRVLELREPARLVVDVQY